MNFRISETTFFKRYFYQICRLQETYSADYTISQLNSTLDLSESDWNQEW